MKEFLKVGDTTYIIVGTAHVYEKASLKFEKP